MTQAKNLEKPVELADDVTAELQAGHEYAAAFYAAGRRSLVASFDVKEVAKWMAQARKRLFPTLTALICPTKSSGARQRNLCC